MPARFQDIRTEETARLVDFSGRLGPQELWSVVEHYPLYAGEYWIARLLKTAELFRETLDVPGEVAEFGSWKGANLVFLAKLLRLFDPHSFKTVHCFDSFEGLTNFSPQDGIAQKYRGTFRGSYEHLMSVIELFRMEREITIHRGDIRNVLPTVLADNPALQFSFVYVDVDLYEPTLTILDQVHDRLTVNGMFVLDEYACEQFPGETLAVTEFLNRHEDSYQVHYLRDTRQPSLALRRIRR